MIEFLIMALLFASSQNSPELGEWYSKAFYTYFSTAVF